MSPELVLLIFLGYTALLIGVSVITSRRANNESYFVGNRQSPWLVVAFGMIGTSLSGVTFISIPGWVGSSQFSYMMVVFGYVAGYAVISLILLPLYYRLKLTSIYSYLDQRFGFWSYKTGAFYFLLSRLIGASFRMFLVVNVLQLFIFDHYNIPFWVTVVIFMLLITIYSFKGGIKTIVWTDMLQTIFMLTALIVTIYIILNKLDFSLGEMISRINEQGYSKIVISDWRHDRFYLKQFFSGMFITIVMTGLDQDMMQKNLSCRNLKDAQKNVTSLSILLIPANLIFLFLGASLYVYATIHNITIPQLTDNLFPELAFNHFGIFAGMVFFIGLIAAAYSSADSAITALTTSVSIDFLGLEKVNNHKRYFIHFTITLIILSIIIIFREINNEAVIAQLFTIAGYTYGPLLGLFAFGLFTKHALKDKFVPLVAFLAPLLTYLININSNWLFNGYQFGFELLILNGILTFTGLWIIKKQSLIKTTP
jgi:Na+/proline symporter